MAGLRRRPEPGRRSRWQRDIWRQSAAEAHRRDPRRKAAPIVNRDEGAAQRPLALGRLRLLARHAGDEAAHRWRLLHADYRIIIAAHAAIADESGTAGQDLRV